MNDIGSAAPSAMVAQKSSGGQKRRVLAGFMAALIPGSGQVWIGKKRGGFALLAIFAAVILLWWPVRLPKSFAGMQLLILSLAGLCMFSTGDALLAKAHAAPRGSRWWLMLLIPVALVTSFAWSNGLSLVAGFRPFDVPSSAMEKTIMKGERILVDLHSYRTNAPRVGDVVVFRKEGLFVIKRVAAASGDTIEGKEGAVFLNGGPLQQPYVQHLGNPPAQLNNFGPLTIPPRELFVMGDNRDVSRDSRMPDFGLVDEKSVIGKALYILRPKTGRGPRVIR